MIDLARLTIKKGDIVKRKFSSDNGNYQPFIVSKVEIDASSLEQIIYSEYGPPVKASEVEVVQKDDASDIASKNKHALESILNSIYGDRWDIQESRTARPMFDSVIDATHVLIIHYPEVIIKNSSNLEHLIRDLYVAIPLSNQYKLGSASIYGSRTSYTTPEYRSGYQHSHLSNGFGARFRSFCTGGDILDEAITDARQVSPSEQPVKYEQFFELLNSFVAWESIEGGPYRRMSSIGMGSGRNIMYDTALINNKDNINKLIQFLNSKDYKLPISIDFNIPDNNYYGNIISFNEDEFERTIKNCLTNNLQEARGIDLPVLRILAIREDRTYYKIVDYPELESIIATDNSDEDTEEFSIRERNESHITFRGNKIKFKEYIHRSNNATSLSIDNIGVPKFLIKGIITNLKLKFYARFFERENEFLEELKSSHD